MTTPGPAPSPVGVDGSAIWGLTGTEWSAVAAIAQGMAALGAMALLLITLWARRETAAALEHSRRLAEATDELVRATQRQSSLGIKPVLEVTYERGRQRFRMLNKGNGPLVRPRVDLEGEQLRLVRWNREADVYAEVGAIGIQEEVFALVPETIGSAPSSRLVIQGVTLTGSVFEASTDLSSYVQVDTVVAVTEFD